MAATLTALLTAHRLAAEDRGLRSSGNVDGFLTWSFPRLETGRPASQVVFWLHASSPEAAAERLAELRRKRAPERKTREKLAAPGAALEGGAEKDVWLRNAHTDFALAPDGAFFWEGGGQQALSRPVAGRSIGKEWTPPALSAENWAGQLSRLSFYLHYRDSEERRAGIRIDGQPRHDGIRIVAPTRADSDDSAITALATADGRLQLEIRTTLGNAACVIQEYVLTNVGKEPIVDVRLSVYANFEADHSHEDDVAALDPSIDGFSVVDAASGWTCVLAGLTPPASGWSGVWPSQRQLAGASGVPRSQWPQAPSFEPKKSAYAAEPPTVTLTPEQADAVLAEDYLKQAEGGTFEVRAAEEIQSAREATARLAAMAPSLEFRSRLAELDELERRLRDSSRASNGKELYLAVRRVKRAIVMSNPLLDFDRVLFIDQPYPHGREWQHQARHRNGMMATPGGRLLLLEGLSPAGKLRKVVDLPAGSYWKPDLSHDARRVLFCYKRADEEAFHIYETDLDTGAVRQLTHGPHDDLDPIYLADGGIAFVSTRTQTYVRCMPYTYVYTLCRMDADGSDIRFISHNNEPDWTPAQLDDGRLLYSRWEYTDKALWRIQSLWTARPDGTQHETFYGNQSVWPDHLGEARQIPDSDKVLFTAMAHHDYFAGTLGIIDPKRGLNYPAGLTQITPEIPWPECGPGPNDAEIAFPPYRHRGRKGNYKSPYPLSEEYFLVSIDAGPYSLYFMDVYGNRELIYHGQHNLWYAQPVRKRPTPVALKSTVQWPSSDGSRQAPGTFFSADVYEGSDIPRGLVKHVQVVEAVNTTFTTWDRDFRFEGPAISAVEADNVKRILGTAPVEADGSFHVEVPSGRTVHFQLLDENYRAVQTMRSFTGLMPGERRGCVGCHEGRGRTPAANDAIALRRGASRLEPPPWGEETISFPRLVQPVLDRYCVKCHDGGPQATEPVLSKRPGTGAESVFYTSYLHLIRSGLAGVIQAEQYDQRDPAAYKTLPPMTSLSYRSRLLELAAGGKHHGVAVDEKTRRILAGWIDANGPFRGLDDVRTVESPQCREPPQVARP
ncbi:MAG: hypothetical protein DCC68_08225 [Planctomycetota bacterium]|nr:MAG: hypothetical protein DCC68_08225 [Planctomycetota bacterium]